MKKDDNVYIGHMLDLSRKAIERTEGIDREAYDADEDLRMILTHLVQMIGEAANRVSPENRAVYSGIPWKQIIGTRHRIVHDYMDVDYDVIWEIVSDDLPPLIQSLASILGE